MQFKDNNSVVSQLNFWKAKLIIINILCINNYTLWQLEGDFKYLKMKWKDDWRTRGAMWFYKQ